MGGQTPSTTPTPRLLLIDNYDSYTFNLYQGLIEVYRGARVDVIRNDEMEWGELRSRLLSGMYHGVVLSPGPGTPLRPGDVGICMPLLTSELALPVLGVCLGMQALALEFGAGVDHAACGPMHGRLSPVEHNGDALFDGIPSGAEFQVVRYHSLEVPQTTVPDCLERLAWVAEDEQHTLMAVRHRQLPYYGVQFHPESVSTTYGPRLLFNFFRIVARWHDLEVPSPPTGIDLRGPPGKAPVSTARLPAWREPGGRMVRLGMETAVYSPARFAGPSASSALSEHLFRTLFAGRDGAWWLDSSLQERGGRWSFMGAGGGPLWRHVGYRGQGSVRETTAGRGPTGCTDTVQTVQETETFWQWLEADLARFYLPAELDLPFDFRGGWVGYLGYELRDEVGAESGARGRQATHVSPEEGPPLASLTWADRFLALDGQTGSVYVAALFDSKQGGDDDGAAAAREARSWVDKVDGQVRAALADAAASGAERAAEREPVRPASSRLQASRAAAATPATSTADEPGAGFSPRENQQRYLESIRACQEALYEGESYELCLTTQLRRQGSPPGFELYCTLREINPAPYAAWLDFSSFDGPQVMCSSPELFLRGDRDGMLEAKPIKGTAPRYLEDPAADAASAAALEGSDKERAENLMIVDLLRNDLGRVCVPGTVHVPALMALESYASVHQLVSTVSGLRTPDSSVVDCLKAAFPGGSMTGAPKLRSMEILAALEAGPRGVYSGAIGYISVNDTFALNIVIRTAVTYGDAISIGAGGAITIQSDPQAEWEEMRLKARAILRAVDRVDARRVA